MLQQFENLNRGDVDRTLAELTANAPAVKQAQAKLDAANRDLDQAELRQTSALPDNLLEKAQAVGRMAQRSMEQLSKMFGLAVRP